MADLEEDDAEMQEDVRLMEHNERFQAAILHSMETQIEQMETRIDAYQHDMKMSNHAREDTALAFLTVKNELRNLKKSLDKTTSELANAQHANKTLVTERNVLQAQNATLEKERQKLASQLARVTDDHQNAANEAVTSKQLIKAFSNDLNVARQIAENYKIELVSVKEQLKVEQKKVGVEKKKFDAKCTELVELLHNQIT